MLASLVEGDTLDVVFDLVRMNPAVYKNVLDTGVGEELESIFDQRSICQRKETLLPFSGFCFKVFIAGNNHSGTFQRKRFESGFE